MLDQLCERSAAAGITAGASGDPTIPPGDGYAAEPTVQAASPAYTPAAAGWPAGQPGGPSSGSAWPEQPPVYGGQRDALGGPAAGGRWSGGGWAGVPVTGGHLILALSRGPAADLIMTWHRTLADRPHRCLLSWSRDAGQPGNR